MVDKLEKQRRVIELFLSRKDATEIAQEVGLTIGHIRKIIKKNGYKNIYKRVKKPKREKRESVVLLYKDGMNIKDIANKTGYGEANVRVILREYKIPRRELHIFNYQRQCFICNKTFTLTKKKYKKKWLCSLECTKINARIHLTIIISKKDRNKIVKYREKFLTLGEIKEKTGISISKIKQILNEENITLSSDQIQKNAYRKKIEKYPNFMNSFREKRMKLSVDEYGKMVLNIIKECEESGLSVFLIASRNGLNPNSISNTIRGMGRIDLLDGHRSSGEKELGDILEKEGVIFKKSDRKIIHPLELDILIENKKVAIEYCGLYWHCEKNGKSYKYHKNKQDRCSEVGIRLITIFEDEWIYRKNQVLGHIKSILGQNSIRVFARKCSVKIISQADASTFTEENHIQGYGRSIISFGLFFEETLLGIVSGSNHHRSNDKTTLILNRLCFKNNYRVVGGASKLLKYLKDWAILNNYKQILSWSDNRWSNGDVYSKIGFAIKSYLKPDYSYIYKNDFTRRVPKQSMTKSALIKKNAVGSTEREMALSLGYHRIWDCGKISWVYDLS